MQARPAGNRPARRARERPAGGRAGVSRVRIQPLERKTQGSRCGILVPSDSSEMRQLKEIDWSTLSRVRVWENVDTKVFASQIVPLAQPAVLRNLVAHWPAVTMARKSPRELSEYIASFGAQHRVKAFLGGPEIKGRFFYSDDLKGFNFERRELALGELLSELLRHFDDDNPPCLYAGAIPLKGELARILDENSNALVDPSREQLASIWIGNRGRAAAHWDLPQNIACVIGGRRRFTLFPTGQLKNLYVGPMELTLAGQPVSLVDFHDPDYEKFPRFKEALASAQVAELEPGDAIYIPSLWFHHVESMDGLGVMINHWWRDAASYMFTPRLTLLHALLSIRDMPKQERQAWRIMFDHYIFQENGDPMAHIPEDARGFFGAMTPDNLARIRARLLHSLGGQPRE